MSSKEEELIFIRQHSKVAIDYAMAGKWKEAIAENLDILNSYPNDIDSLNRLGRAYLELNKLSEAKEAYLKAKELDPYNNISIKNLAKLENIQDGSLVNSKSIVSDSRMFIEEVGKSSNVNVIITADKKTLATLSAGDSVDLKSEENHLNVYSVNGKILGRIEAQIEKRLLKLIAGGNKYQAIISSSSLDNVTILIRETYQDPSQIGIMSFTSKGVELDSLFNKDSQVDSEENDADNLDEGAEYNDEEPEIMDDDDENDDDENSEKDGDDEEV